MTDLFPLPLAIRPSDRRFAAGAAAARFTERLWKLKSLRRKEQPRRKQHKARKLAKKMATNEKGDSRVDFSVPARVFRYKQRCPDASDVSNSGENQATNLCFFSSGCRANEMPYSFSKSSRKFCRLLLALENDQQRARRFSLSFSLNDLLFP